MVNSASSPSVEEFDKMVTRRRFPDSTRASTPMHHALDLPEILYNIFGHIVPEGDRAWTYEEFPGIRTLAGLARTCQTFKEPALDVLWSELPDLSALARCVPNAVYSKKQCRYAFKRPLADAEWDTIKSYTRRVWIFRNCALMDECLEENSIAMLFSYTRGTLFPSLRSLSWSYGRPFPPLRTASQPLRILYLDCRCGEIHECQGILESAGNLCPLVMKFQLRLSHQEVEFDSIVSNVVLRWPNLRILECSEVALNADAILHISRISTLTHLSFVLSEEAADHILHSDFLLVFSYLAWCEITSKRLSAVANLLTCARLPAVQELAVKFSGPLSKQTLRSFMIGLRNSRLSGTLTHLSILSQRCISRPLSPCGGVGLNGDYAITYDDLCPCAALGNLRSLKVNFEQPVHLTDNNLVDLGSAWPNLEDFIINKDAGWRSASGLTLHGLIRLLRACPALRNFCILLDTSTFTGIPEGMDVTYPKRQLGHVNLVESPLNVDMFTGVVNVFVAIGFSPCFLMAWQRMEAGPRRPMSMTRTMSRSWRDVAEEVRARIARGTDDCKD